MMGVQFIIKVHAISITDYCKVQVITGVANYCFIVRVLVVTEGADYRKVQVVTGTAGYCKDTGCVRRCSLS